MKLHSSFGFACLLSLGAILGGCEACETPPDDPTEPEVLPTEPEPGVGPDDDGGIPNEPDAGPENEPEPDAPPNSRVLSYDGDNPLEVYFGEEPRLTFLVEDTAGAAINNARVQYSFSGTGGSLNVAESRSNSDGEASVVFRAGNNAGSGTLTVSTNGSTGDLTVDIDVLQNPIGELEIAVSSITRIPLARAEVMVFMTPDDGTPPTCAELAEAATLPTATFAAPFSMLPATQLYEEIDHGSRVTAYGLGYDEGDNLIGSGCFEGVSTIGGTTTEIGVVLAQLPTIVEGEYDVLAQVDLGVALPDPYDTYVTTTTAILADPAGYAAYQALLQLDRNLGTSFMNGGAATYEEVRNGTTYATDGSCVMSTFNVWCTVKNLAQNTAVMNLPAGVYEDVTLIGGDIDGLIREFEVGNHVNLEQRERNGDIYDVTEQWKDLVFTWTRGCADPGDLDCVRRPFVVDNTEYTIVQSNTYGAQLSHDPEGMSTERFRLNAEPHGMSFSYGTVLVIALNELVFPSLPPNIAGHSLEEVILNIINCENLGIWINSNTGVPAATAETACVSGVSALTSFAEGELLDLQFGSTDPTVDIKGQEGLYSAGHMIFTDEDLNLEAETVAAYNFTMGWNDPDDPDATADISSPITGDGRLAASDCTNESGATGCLDTESCQPIPHYLKVALAEYDCRPATGDTVGEGDCTEDADCRSGLCMPDGKCFLRCDNNDDCSTDTCGFVDDVLDISHVMTGLTDASVFGCKPATQVLCENTCGFEAQWANDGYCDDGGEGSDFAVCDLGTDCGDCGPR